MSGERDDLDEFAVPIGTGMVRSVATYEVSDEVTERLEKFARVRRLGEAKGRTFYVG